MGSRFEQARFAMIVIPSIDLREGRVVRLQQGDYSRQLNYDVDPIETAKQFAAAGAKWMHIVDLDAKDGIVATRAWTESSGRNAVEIAKSVSDWPLAGILYTDVASDGMMSGPNYEQTRKLADAGKVAVIASGGVGNIEHIRKLKELPIWGVIVGRSLYEGALDLQEAVRISKQ